MVIYFVLWALIITWPMPLHPAETFVGKTFLYEHIGLWNTAINGLLESGSLPIVTRYYNYPEGGSISLIGWSFILIILPMRMIGFGTHAATNIALLIHIFLGCYGTYMLARRLIGKRAEAMFAGTAFGLAPFVFAFIENGQYPKLACAFIPWAVLAKLRLFESRKPIYIFYVGFLLALTFATSPYMGMIAAIITLCLGVYWIFKTPCNLRTWTTFLFIFAALTSMLFTAPFVSYFFKSYYQMPDVESLLVAGGGEHRIPPPENALRFGRNKDEKSLFALWLKPGKIDPIPGIPDLYAGFYLGWIMLLSSIACLIYRKQARPLSLTPLALFFLAGIFFILSHGFYFWIFGHPLRTPLYWIARNFSFATQFQNTQRMVVGVGLCFALMGAVGLARAGRCLANHTRIFLVVAAISAFMFETLFLSPAPFPLSIRQRPTPQVYRDLAEIPGCPGIAIWPPVRASGLKKYRVPYWQITHKKPTTFRFDPPRDKSYFYRKLSSMLPGTPIFGQAPKPETSREYLPFHYFLFQGKDWGSRFKQPTLDFLDRHLDRVKTYPEREDVLFVTRKSPKKSEKIPAESVGTSFYRRPGLPEKCDEMNLLNFHFFD